MSRTAIAILSTENLLHNLTVIKSRISPQTKVIAITKANAYGHGIRSVAMRLNKHVDLIGVASIDEALALRNVGVTAGIMLLEGVFQAGELMVAAAEGFHVVFHNNQQLRWIENINNLPMPLFAWIKINTGMGRIGFRIEEIQDSYKRMRHCDKLVQPIKLMSHFACSENSNHPLNYKQIQLFNEVTANMDGQRSMCNSGAIFNFPECEFDYVRSGLALYGVSPLINSSASDLGIKPVMTLQTTLISVYTAKRGDTVGYGARYTCPEDMPIGVLAFGYGDGYPISAPDGTPVLVNNEECSIIGRVSMDMITVDLRNCPNAKIGDTAVLWGEGLPLERIANHTNCIPWSLLTGIQNRVKFIWTRA
jgi:alanine racemase